MTKSDLKKFLTKKPSYLKKGPQYLSKTFGVTVQEAHEVLIEVKGNKLNSKIARELMFGKAELPKSGVAGELLEKFKMLSRQLSEAGVTFDKAPVDVIERKREVRVFHTPSLKEQVGMHILLGCNHVPFHNRQLHHGILELIKDYPELIKGFHLLGDFLDLNPLSSHDRGKFTAVPGLTLNDEYQIGSDLLYDFDNVLPEGVWKTYMYGNHEDRYNRWMSDMNNAKTPLISPEEGLRLWQRGYNVKTSWSQDFVTLGLNFDIFHGIYFSIHNGKAHLDKLRRNCAYVHTHRTQVYREGEMAAYNIGSCADFGSKAFNYANRAMKSSWSNGFAINMIDENGISHVTQIYVDPKGHFYFGGKRY